jgi:hypothetical protein
MRPCLCATQCRCARVASLGCRAAWRRRQQLASAPVGRLARRAAIQVKQTERQRGGRTALGMPARLIRRGPQPPQTGEVGTAVNPRHTTSPSISTRWLPSALPIGASSGNSSVQSRPGRERKHTVCSSRRSWRRDPSNFTSTAQPIPTAIGPSAPASGNESGKTLSGANAPAYARLASGGGGCLDILWQPPRPYGAIAMRPAAAVQAKASVTGPAHRTPDNSSLSVQGPRAKCGVRVDDSMLGVACASGSRRRR